MYVASVSMSELHGRTCLQVTAAKRARLPNDKEAAKFIQRELQVGAVLLLQYYLHWMHCLLARCLTHGVTTSPLACAPIVSPVGVGQAALRSAQRELN